MPLARCQRPISCQPAARVHAMHNTLPLGLVQALHMPSEVNLLHFTCKAAPTSATGTMSQAGRQYSLKEVLQRWRLPHEFHAHMADTWRCQLAVPCDTDAAVAAAVARSAPALVPQACGEDVCQATGSDALEFIQVRACQDGLAARCPSGLCCMSVHCCHHLAVCLPTCMGSIQCAAHDTFECGSFQPPCY